MGYKIMVVVVPLLGFVELPLNNHFLFFFFPVLIRRILAIRLFEWSLQNQALDVHPFLVLDRQQSLHQRLGHNVLLDNFQSLFFQEIIILLLNPVHVAQEDFQCLGSVQ